MASRLGPNAGRGRDEEKEDEDEDDGLFARARRAGGGALGAALSVLDKPGQAIRSGMARASEAAYRGDNPLESLGSFAQGAGAGLIGRDHTSASEVTAAATTGDRDKAAKLPFGVDTGLSIALDPTTYLSLGATAAAKAGLRVAARELGEETAKEIVEKGARKALTTESRATLRNAIERSALDAGLSAEKAARTAARQMKAMNRSARGGVKFAGRSVPGLTSQSTIGRAAAQVSPRKLGREALQATGAGRTVRQAFVRGAEVEDTLGSEVAGALRTEVTGAADRATLKQATTEKAAQNLAKAGNLSDISRSKAVTAALDIDPVTVAARKKADDAFRDAVKAERKAVASEARHADVSRNVDETLTAKRKVLEALKADYEDVLARVGSIDPKVVSAAGRAVKVAANDLERTAEKFSTSASRQGIEQIAGVERSMANHAIDEARAARAAIPEHTKEAIAAMRAAGDDSLADVTQFSDDLRRRITNEQADAGLLVKGAHETEEYVPRYFTKNGKKWLEANAAKVADAMSSPGRKVVSSEIKHAIHQGEAAMRKLRPELGLEGLNDFARAAGFKGDLVETNALSAIVRRAHSADAAVEHVRLIEKVSKMKGPDGEPLLRAIEPSAKPANGKAALDLVEDAGVRYEGDPAVVNLLNEARAITTNDVALKALQGKVAEITKVWRSMATFGPAFHARNEAGNVWLNYLAGVRNPAHYARAASLQKAAREAFGSLGTDANLDNAISALNISDPDKALLRSAMESGVVTHGFFAEDLVRTPVALGGKRTAKEKALLPLSKANQANKGLGSFFENNARLAHYIAKVEELGDPAAAAASVKKYLFDYGDLTPFEKWAKNVIPFYTFMRKNAPIQIEAAFTNPGKFTKYAHLSNDAYEHGMTEQPDVPISSLDSTLRPLLGTQQAGNRTTSRAQNMFQGLVGPVTPLIKTPIEVAVGGSSYNGYPLRDGAARREHLIRNMLPPVGKVDGARRNSVLRSVLGFEDLAPSKETTGRTRKKRPSTGSSRLGPGA